MPEAQTIGLGVHTVDPQRHMIEDTPFTSYARRELDQPDLLTYWHRYRKTWVLGCWLDEQHTLFQELAVLGPAVFPPRWLSKQVMGRLAYLFSTSYRHRAQKALAAERSDERAEIAEEMERVEELWRKRQFLKNRQTIHNRDRLWYDIGNPGVRPLGVRG